MNEKVSFDLSGKRALVTGGRRGIGLAIARALHDHGAAVTVTGAREGAETEKGFPFRRVDLCDHVAIKALSGGFDGLDILVNNAGAIVRGGGEYEPEVFSKIIDTNLNGTYRMCQAFLSQLKVSRGCIINIVSVAAFTGSPHAPAYGAAKAGIMHLTRSLAIQWAPDGIRVNAIAPGATRTDMNITVQQDEVASRRVEDSIPMGRWGLPYEIAGAAVYLASSAASYTTGTCISVDGGNTA
jgi:NAD(P)-dependent dehydrogenase (short-subunit alcohol dehydrogenase family)